MDLDTFLHQFRIVGKSHAENKNGNGNENGNENGTEHKNRNEITHTSIGNPKGSFSIPFEEKETLCELIYQQVFKRKIPVHLTEAPQPHTNIKIDLDFKFPIEENRRHYTLKHIKGIVEKYNDAIRNYMDVPDEKMLAFVFERDSPYKSDKGQVKDGIHVIYPYIICHTKIQHLIRKHVLKYCDSILAEIESTNTYENIIDACIIDKNNWLMYGCSKLRIKPYTLTHVFDAKNNDLDLKTNGYSNSKELIMLLSIRDHSESESIPIREEYLHLITNDSAPIINEADIKKTLSKIKTSHKTTQNYENKNVDLDNVKELIKMLSSDRAEDYASWIEVGLCLHNISPSLLSEWIEFSRKSEKGKLCKIFEDSWANMKSMEVGGIGIGSLHLWARLDSPEDYLRYKQNSISVEIIKSTSMSTYDTAIVVHKLYQHQFVCTSQKDKGKWYEFKNHRWHHVDAGYSLQNKFSKEVIDEYLKLIKYYSESAYELEGDARENQMDKLTQLLEVTHKLRDITFKKKIMEECKILFYDSTFENRLDSNPDLICFENGVYDLVHHKFRDGCPEDCVSMTAGIDYETFESTDQVVIDIFSFLAQVFPDREIREYVITMLGSIMEGRNPQEQFYIWTGVGGNGKSKLLELFEMCAGKYAAKVPVTVFTQKKAASNAATPEIARLRGVRCTSSQETEETEKFNIAVVKEWSGNDNILARPLFGDCFEFKPQFKQIFCCNDKPILPPDDIGIWRRIVVVDFPSRFVENPDPNNPYEFKRDYRLAEKFQSWRSAFMWIILQFYKNVYKKVGLKEPKSIIEAKEEYRSSNDEMSEFKREYIVKDENSSIKLKESYKVYQDWFKEVNGNSRKPAIQTLYKTAMERKLGKYNITRGWVGWKLIDKSSESTEIVIEKKCLMDE